MKKYLLIFFVIFLIGCEFEEEIIEIPFESNLDPIVLFCPQDGCSKNHRTVVVGVVVEDGQGSNQPTAMILQLQLPFRK